MGYWLVDRRPGSADDATPALILLTNWCYTKMASREISCCASAVRAMGLVCLSVCLCVMYLQYSRYCINCSATRVKLGFATVFGLIIHSPKNNGTFLWNFVLNSEFRKISPWHVHRRQVLSVSPTIDRRPSPVYHTQRPPALCSTSLAYAARHAGPSASAETSE